MTTLNNNNKYARMAEQLFVDFRGDRLSEDHQGYSRSGATLSKSIVVNGDTRIPENSTLIIDRPIAAN